MSHSSDFIRALTIETARQDFFAYCTVRAPDFYKFDRDYLVDLCNKFQDFIVSEDEKILIINLPPRFGKSRTATLFVEWALGHNPELKIMTASYNERLSTTFSKSVRDGILEIKADPTKIVYSDIFPQTKIKRGDAAANYWSLDGQYSNYLATSPRGTATGYGADLIIVDDLIKNAYDAYNVVFKEQTWDWFRNTLISRLEAGGKMIIIMTRWASDDLCGRMIRYCEEENRDYSIIVYKAHDEEGNMLCESVLSKQDFEFKSGLIAPEIISANYLQIPIDLKNVLYKQILTYDELPVDKNGQSLIEQTRCYIDTADTGNDYLCAIVYGKYDMQAYVLDVLYTKAHMEATEPQTAEMLVRNEVDICDIESNSGGRGFARAVERILKQEYNTNKTVIKSFHQSKNKDARILSNATWIMQNVFMPNNWRVRFPDFYKAITTYQAEGKNDHDDAADALTGVCEKIQQGNTFILSNKRRR